MKKLLLLCLLLLGTCLSAVSAEQTNQTIENKNSYLGLNFEKKPIQETGKQSIKNEKSFLFINIIINGKVPFEPNKGNN